MQLRVVLADDHNLVRSGLAAILTQEGRFDVVAEATNGYEVIERLRTAACDLLIADLAMPRMGGIELIQMLRGQKATIKILVLSMYDDVQFVVRAMNAGANGYLLKHAMDDELFRAIDAVIAGEVFISELIDPNALRECRLDDSELTARELEVLKLISEGLTNPEIAELLNISPNTAVRHRANLMRKLNVHNRVELINTAFNRGLITMTQ